MKRAVALDPLAPRILDNYGGYLIWLGKYPEALGVLDQVLAIQPGSAQANCFRGMALVKAGRVEEGLSILETLARQPTNRSGLRARWPRRFSLPDGAGMPKRCSSIPPRRIFIADYCSARWGVAMRRSRY